MYKVSYVSDGETTEFVFSFPFFQTEDVHVAIDNKILDTSQYSVVENTSFDGGYVVFPTPPLIDSQIDIYRQVSLSRVVDYQPTAKIDPENLNADFNLLLEAFKDYNAPNIDIEQWRNTHNTVMTFLQYVNSSIEDKLNGGGVLGLYKNLIMVLENAAPRLINDYGDISDSASDSLYDDYGIL